MTWMHTAELVVLILTAAILMWDDRSTRSAKRLGVRVKTDRDGRSRRS